MRGVIAWPPPHLFFKCGMHWAARAWGLGGFHPQRGARGGVGTGPREWGPVAGIPWQCGVTSAAAGTQITGLSTLLQVQGFSWWVLPQTLEKLYPKGSERRHCSVLPALSLCVFKNASLFPSNPRYIRALGAGMPCSEAAGGRWDKKAQSALVPLPCFQGRSGSPGHWSQLHSGVCWGPCRTHPTSPPKAPETPPLRSTRVLGQKAAGS